MNMLKSPLSLLIIPALLSSVGTQRAFAVPAHSVTKGRNEFSIKPSDVKVPANARLGEYERTIRPYANGWTLICDVNMSAKRKTCNVTQNIIGKTGEVEFSWSLAATSSGQPLFILRVPSSTRGSIAVDPLDNRGFPLMVNVEGCAKKVCVSYLPLDYRLKDNILKGREVKVMFYTDHPHKDYELYLPLKGLSKALDGI